jgi:hypothetical protein
MAAGRKPCSFERLARFRENNGVARVWFGRRWAACEHAAGWRESRRRRNGINSSIDALGGKPRFEPKRWNPTVHSQRQHQTVNTERWNAAFRCVTFRWHR